MIMISVREIKTGKTGLIREIDFFNEMMYIEDIGWRNFKDIELAEGK